MRGFSKALPCAVLVLAGCSAGASYATYDSYGYGDDYGAIYADVAPPGPLIEVVPPSPGPGYAWIGGYWAWTGRRYVWQPGRWVVRPRGLVWVPHGWVIEGGRYRYVPGRWVPRARYRAVPYVHRIPPVRYGDRYAVIPYAARPHPYAYVPPAYRHPRYRGYYDRWYRARPYPAPPARAYVVP